MEDSDLLPILYSTHDVADILGLTRQHVGELCREGLLIAQQINGTWIITPAAVKKYLAKPKNGRGKYDRAAKGLKKGKTN